MYSREFNKHFSTGYHDDDDDDGDFMFMSNFISILEKKEGKNKQNTRYSLQSFGIYVACLVGFFSVFIYYNYSLLLTILLCEFCVILAYILLGV